MPEPETRGHITGFREQIAEAGKKGREEFFTWFDRSPGSEGALVRGVWDFALHIARPLAGWLKEPEKKTILEIGYGGGRLLAPAARAFGRAIGVDVHECRDLVREELARLGVTNAELHTSDGKSIPVPDASVDVVYSFIVLHHVEKLSIFTGLIEETARVLKQGGFAVLYYGRLSTLSFDSDSRLRVFLDRLIEETLVRDTYRERPAAVNDVNLVLAAPLARSICARAGLVCRDSFISRKRVPDGFEKFGRQMGLLLEKVS